MSIILYRTPQYSTAEVEVSVSGEVLTINGEDFDLSGLQGRFSVESPYVTGFAFRLGDDIHVKVVQPYSGEEEPVEDEAMPEPPALPPPPTPSAPYLFGTVAVCISAGVISTIEMAAQLQGAMYEEGWLMIGFSEQQDAADYLVFAQTDVPAKIEQFKDGGAFELVFSDPSTGAPLEPSRVDIQILKVR